MTQPIASQNETATWQCNAAGWRLMRGQRELAHIHLLSPDCAADFPLGIQCEILLTGDNGERHFYDYGGSAAKAKAIAYRAALANHGRQNQS